MIYYLFVHPNRERAIQRRIYSNRCIKDLIEDAVVMYPGMGYIKVTARDAINPEHLRITGVYRVLEEEVLC